MVSSLVRRDKHLGFFEVSTGYAQAFFGIIGRYSVREPHLWSNDRVLHVKPDLEVRVLANSISDHCNANERGKVELGFKSIIDIIIEQVTENLDFLAYLRGGVSIIFAGCSASPSVFGSPTIVEKERCFLDGLFRQRPASSMLHPHAFAMVFIRISNLARKAHDSNDCRWNSGPCAQGRDPISATVDIVSFTPALHGLQSGKSNEEAEQTSQRATPSEPVVFSLSREGHRCNSVIIVEEGSQKMRLGANPVCTIGFKRNRGVTQ